MTIVRTALFAGLGLLLLSCSGSGNNANCGAFCSVAAECGGEDRAACLNECEDDSAVAEEISAACFDAFAGVNGCVGGLTCPQAEAWLEEVPPDGYPCRDADLALDEACFTPG